MFRIEQNGKISLGRPKLQTKGSSAPDEEEGGVDFQIVLKQNYTTAVTIRPACVQKYGFASSRAFAFSTL